MASQDVEFAFADEDIAELRGVLEQEGVDEIGEADDSEFLPGILVVIAVVALTNVIIKLSRLWKCGIVVDARTDVLRTQKDCDLPRGTVIVLEKGRHQAHPA